jgi:hypothetical protein
MAVRRSSLFCLILLLAAAMPAKAQVAAQWERGAKNGTIYANLGTSEKDLFGFFCRESNNTFVGGILLRIPDFRTGIRNGESYSLNIVVDGNRDSVVMKAKDVDLWFEADDLNQQLALGRIVDTVKSAHSLELAVSAIGWRESYQFNGADKALAGILDRCL